MLSKFKMLMVKSLSLSKSEIHGNRSVIQALREVAMVTGQVDSVMMTPAGQMTLSKRLLSTSCNQVNSS